MTRQEWISQAEEYDRKAQESYDRGDDTAGELWQRKAESCRYAACYGTEE